MNRRTIALTTAAVLAVPAVALTWSPAQARPLDIERHGVCGAGDFEFSVDREGNRFEIDTQLDHLPPGQRWRIVLKHDGVRYAKVTRAADYEGEIDVDRVRSNSAGADVFTFRATRVGAAGSCGATISTN